MIQFSVIIPTRNRAKELHRLLNEVAGLCYPKENYEVIVVNNNSHDNTEDVIRKFIKTNPNISCRPIMEKQLGPSFARNSGAKVAKYRYAVFIDDDISINKNLLLKYRLLIKKDPSISVAAGKIIAVSEDKDKLSYFKQKFKDDLWVFSESTKVEEPNYYLKFPDNLISANLLVNLEHCKKPIFNTKYGRFYKNLLVYAEDSEFVMRRLLEKKKVLYVSSIVSKHNISRNRLNYKFVLGRFFKAGVEQQMLDQEFKDVPQYIRYRFEFTNLLKQIMFLLGYNFPTYNRSV